MMRRCKGFIPITNHANDHYSLSSIHSKQFRSLRHDNKISRQSNFHFQNFIVMTFPMKNSVLDIFFSLPPPPVEKRKFYFYCRLAFSDSSRITPITFTRLLRSRELWPLRVSYSTSTRKIISLVSTTNGPA